MRRREFITLLGGAAAWPIAARAQQPARYQIGHLAIAAPTDVPPPPPANWDAFVQGLREIGYMEGQNIAFEHRSAHDQPELFPKLALELASLKVDVIFARGTWALAAAKNATRTIPIVGIDLEIDPVEAGLVASIARPGGNITGLFLDLSELSGKHLQILKEIIPGTSRVAVLGNPDINATQIRELERVARPVALQIRAVDMKAATDLNDAFDTAKDWRAEPSSFYQIRSVSLTEHKSELSQRRLGCRRFTFTGRTWMREVSSPMDRTFRICFVVVAFTLVAYWAALSLQTFPLNVQRGSSWSSTSRSRKPSE
jgi:putative tryptophan/tyrosine transport system substrate-binding protein